MLWYPVRHYLQSMRRIWQDWNVGQKEEENKNLKYLATISPWWARASVGISEHTDLCLSGEALCLLSYGCGHKGNTRTEHLVIDEVVLSIRWHGLDACPEQGSVCF